MLLGLVFRTVLEFVIYTVKLILNMIQRGFNSWQM